MRKEKGERRKEKGKMREDVRLVDEVHNERRKEK